MSTRIIIEHDGERYVANDLEAWIIDGGRAISIENKTDYVSSSFTKLPPVIRTDNSAVIANLEAENAKLRDALKPVLAVHLCDGETTPWSDLLIAVRKAQAIMNGEKK